jgi:hypothetical protein
MDSRIDISSYNEPASPRYSNRPVLINQEINRSVVSSPKTSTINRRQSLNSPSINSRVWSMPAYQDKTFTTKAPLQQVNIYSIYYANFILDENRNASNRRIKSFAKIV